MTLQNFIDKWNGKFTKWNPIKDFQEQCQDLVHQYIQDFLNLDAYSIGRALKAKDIFYNFVPNKNYTKVINRPWNSPKKGDIVFFGVGEFGHVSICVNSNIWSLLTFDENFPLNQPCKLVNHSYIKDKVLGWLSPIQTIT